MNKKQYYQLNKERIKAKNLERYYKNKATINQKVRCECGREVQKQFMNEHLKRGIHHRLMGIEKEYLHNNPKIKCSDCDRVILSTYTEKHQQNKIHLELKQIEEQFRSFNPPIMKEGLEEELGEVVQ